MIDELTIRRVKDAANVYDVIGDFFHLVKKGADYQCLCPFHDDKHLGSFTVSRVKNLYCCFSCGARGDSIQFLMEHQHLSYPDALRWLGQKYGISVDDEQKKFIVRHAPQNQPMPKVEELPMLVLPYSYVTYTLNTEEDALCQWIRSLPWNDEQAARVEQTLKNYVVGHTTKYANGSNIEAGAPAFTIFWQIDDRGQVRTGKMMRYKPDGHRYKPDQLRYNTDWIHARLFRTGKRDPSKLRKVNTLFGMHLLNFCPDATVNIVESEKTALICSIAYGDMKRQLWMACGGINQICSELLEPLIRQQRHIVLYPDHDGISAWKDVAQQIGYKKLFVNDDLVSKIWLPEDGQKADIADMLIRIMHTKPRTSDTQKVSDVIQQMTKENPVLQTLIEKFNLEQVT